MIITINIDCETKDELIQHLKFIEEKVITQFTEFNDSFKSEDNNCYGTHDITILNS